MCWSELSQVVHGSGLAPSGDQVSGWGWCSERTLRDPYGTAPAIRDKRVGVLTDAYATHPERFVRKPPRTGTTADRIMDQPPSDTEETAQ